MLQLLNVCHLISGIEVECSSTRGPGVLVSCSVFAVMCNLSLGLRNSPLQHITRDIGVSRIVPEKARAFMFLSIHVS